MPELPDDDIQRMPDADRIRNRIRERRESEQTEQTGEGVKFEAPSDDPTSTNLKWNNIVDGGDTTAMKLDGAEHLDPNDPASWKVDQVKTGDIVDDGSPTSWKSGDIVDDGDGTSWKSGDIIDPLDRDWKVEEGESLRDAAATGQVKTGEFIDTDTDSVVDHKADDVAMKLDQPDTDFEEIKVTFDDPIAPAHKAGEITDRIDPAWKIEEGESLRDTAATGQVKTGEFIDTDTDSVVDHEADDIDGPVTNDPLAYEEIKVTLTDPLPDGVVDHKADDVVDHKADDVDGPISNDPFNYEEIKVTFDDPITENGLVDKASPQLDKSSPKGLPVDETADVTNSDGNSVIDGTFKFAVPTDVPGEGESFKDVSGMDEAIVPTGETAMQQTADPVGDALAPLDGGDQLVDPAPESADLIAQIDGLHDDDGLDDSFGA